MTTDAAKPWVQKAVELGPIIREHAEEADRNRRMSEAVVEALHESGLNRILLPTEMGGAGLTIPDSLEIIEALSKADASVGWTYAIACGSPVFGMRLTESAFRTVFSDPRALVAGSLGPTARAIPVEGGYRFSGMATVASGAWNASWLQIAGVISDGDNNPVLANGNIQTVSALLPMAEAELLDTWNPVGMRGTGSIDCRVQDVFVSDDYIFTVQRPLRWDSGVFGAIPLPLQLAPGLAAVAVGTAAGAIDEFIEMANKKISMGATRPLSHGPVIQLAVGEATGLVDAARATLQRGTADVWQRGLDRAAFDLPFQARYRMACITAARLSRQAVELLKVHAGTGATNLTNRFGRAWRDVDTIPSHLLLGPLRTEIAGRVLLGLSTSVPFV